MQECATSIQMDIPGVELLDVAAVADPDLTHDGWVRALRELGQLAARSGWWLGDLFIEGQARWGKGYAKMAAREAGLSPGTVVTYASMSRNVSPAVRRADLSHAHHALVAWIREPDEQARLLEYAAQHDLTVEEFRRELGRGKPSAPGMSEPFTVDDLHVETCPTCGRAL